MIDYFITQNPDWLKKWDDFIEKHPQGNHLQYSHWVKSYLSYGFEYEIGIAVKDFEIVGGYAAVVAKKFGFGFYCISNGPVFNADNEETVKGLIDLAKKSAKKRKCCCIQLTTSFDKCNNQYQRALFSSVFKNVKQGNPFPFIYASKGLNWVDFNTSNSSEEFLQQYVKTNVRRDIRSAQRKEIEVRQIKEETEIKQAYAVFENNARTLNYSIRNWEEFKSTIIALIEEKRGILLGGYHEQKLKGAIFLVKAGEYYTYIMGGTLKEKPDLLMGELLQWNAIEMSFGEDFSGYNISLGGSDGVVNFKNKFSPKINNHENNSYYWVLKPIQFKIYQKIYVYLKKYKPIIAKMVTK